MNTESLQTACREAARAAGLGKRVTVHTLRHSFATYTRIDTTARYAAVSPNAVGAVRSPLDSLGQPPKPNPKAKAKR